ncbi:MAG: septum formation initiator family protein [Candidatus Omnitrophica bacterium]|nr:septum formation initiator family protein [Candidatus Omnitrophota bacterium]HOX54786.1 septum formation initiator family protein [Candidatus Omnitrophota bacterium]
MKLKKATWLFAFAFIVFIIFLPGYSKLQDLKQKNLELENKIAELQKKNTELTNKEKLLENDPFYLEKVAREKMGVTKKGEVVYKITGE